MHLDIHSRRRSRGPVSPSAFDLVSPPVRKAVLGRPSGTGRESGSAFEPGRKDLLVCFSHLRWDFVWQRPQHLLSRAADNYRVVVFEEPRFDGDAEPVLDVSNRPGRVEVAVPHLPEGFGAEEAVAAQRALLDGLLAEAGTRAPTFWYYTPMAMAFSAHCERSLTVYDNMDELSAFHGASPELIQRERQLLLEADLVFTGGFSLFEAKRDRHPAVHAFPSSIDAVHFAQARQCGVTARAEPGRPPRPQLGFFGVIDERLDLDLVAAAADLRPDWQFDMVGPVVKIDPAMLPRRPNIDWSGPCAYAVLPQRIGSWDVGIMPFALNEATRFISPTKTPEFLAAGIPVVSTPIVDVVRSYGSKGLVEMASTAEDLVDAAERLMARPKEPWLDAVDRELAVGSWDRTWAEMQGLMRAAKSTARSQVPITAEPMSRAGSRDQPASNPGSKASHPSHKSVEEFTAHV